MKKKVGCIVVCCIMVMFLFACGNHQEYTMDKVHIGVVYYNHSDTFLVALLNSFKEELKGLEDGTHETTVMIRDAASSQRTQNDQVKEMIDAGCNVLCVNLVDRADPSEIIDLARDHNVPIIFFNREPVVEDMMQWDRLYYVGADAKQSGILQGEIAADVIKRKKADRNQDGKIQYVVMEGEAGHQDAIIRTENAVKTLKEKGIELEKLSCQIANWNRAQAQNRMGQMISRYQNKIELVLSNNDDMALGAIDAYKKLNYTENNLPLFFGVDGTEVGLKAIKDLSLSGTIYNDKEGQAEAMAKLAVAVVTKKGMDKMKFKNEKYIYSSYYKVTSDNVDDFLNKK